MRMHVIALGAFFVVGAVMLSAAYAADEEVLLGAQTLDPNSKKIVIRADRSQGKFSMLRFTADGQNIEIHKIRLNFSGGRDWELATRMPFSGDGRSQYLDLPGGKHNIEKIVLFYRVTGPKNGDKAEVKVFGIR